LTFITSDHWCSSYGLDDVGGQHLDDSLDDTFTTVSECGLDDVGGQLLDDSLDDTFAATVVAQPGEVKATARRGSHCGCHSRTTRTAGSPEPPNVALRNR
jgi:hypothetical protein